jgi:hypothetical protein
LVLLHINKDEDTPIVKLIIKWVKIGFFMGAPRCFFEKNTSKFLKFLKLPKFPKFSKYSMFSQKVVTTPYNLALGYHNPIDSQAGF